MNDMLAKDRSLTEDKISESVPIGQGISTVPMNIILDMDQTLIFEAQPRPYLDVFLEICFVKFQNVSIWTAASRGWFDCVNEYIFEPILEEIRRKYSKNFQFDFVFTQDRCSIVRAPQTPDALLEAGGGDIQIEKRLKKIFRSKSKYKDYTRGNTIVIDDNPFTFRKNYGNGVCVVPYFGGYSDCELLCVVIYLLKILVPHFQEYGTVRDLNKRGWKRYV